MIRIETCLVGAPRAITDADGTWRSAIFREAVAGPIALGARGLEGDAVADTKHHGSPDQAVCCHPMAHYDHWNALYSLEGSARIGPGAVGENWTVSGATEADVCIGDVFDVGTARVQVSVPRIPCWKQERKLGLPGFLGRSVESLRTGFYVRVLSPGTVRAGDAWVLRERPHPGLTVHAVNLCRHSAFDPEIARRAASAGELPQNWRDHFRAQLEAVAG